jgi:GxxExxY protein
MKTWTMEIGAAARKDPRTYAIIGAAMEVHKHLGCGFLEPVYQESLTVELSERSVQYRREVELPVFYKRKKLNTMYRADFICFDSVIVELKALVGIGRTEEAQIINYLKATGFEVGLLLNFGAASLEYRRFAFSKSV